MADIPLDQPPARRRIGPFWIEEGLGPLAFALAVVAVVVVLYIVSAITNHPG